MNRKRHVVKSECPDCGCGLISHMAPEVYREKFKNGGQEVEVICPMCGKKHKAILAEDEGH